MRSTVSRLSLAAALLVAAAPQARAQAAVATPVRPAVRIDGALEPRLLAVYRFNPAPIDGIPAEVTVADSAGQLVAWFRLPGDRVAQPMLAVVVGDDLVLQGETPRGVLTLQLAEANEEPSQIVGRWRLEEREGTLRGRVKR